MNRYRAEILGRVPNGLTHNDVFATVNMMLRGMGSPVHSVTKRRLAGNMISIVCVYDADTERNAAAKIMYAQFAVTNFSADIIGPKEVKP